MRVLIFITLFAVLSYGARVKDMARLKGLEEMHLVGYGLVVGLGGTGDGQSTQFTTQSVINMLRNMGIEVPDDKVRTRNVAAVMVTATLKPFKKKGSKLDVTVSSMGDARSLEGGTLLMTPLQGADGEVYALAQGPMSVGGMSASSYRKKSSVRKNHVLAGNIPSGAVVEQELASYMQDNGVLRWELNDPDFTSAMNMANQINTAMGQEVAVALDAATIEVRLSADQQRNPMMMIARTEQVDFATSVNARVILNEKTGTIVAGADVRLSEVAVSHGNITINIESQEEVSQPNAMAAGQTQSVVNEQVAMQETPEKSEMRVIPQVQSVQELADALNTLGVSPRDIVSIFQAIRRAGALQAELIIM